MQDSDSPLLYDEAAVAKADTIVIFVPGALSPISIFEGAEDWRERYGLAHAYYRLPGLDVLAQDPPLKIDTAADTIVAFARRFPGKRVRIVGYSTGGPIAIVAAEQLPGDVRVAAISTAVERAGGISTTIRGLADMIAAAVRTGSLDREKVWLEYYRTLLFGRAGLRNVNLQPVIEKLVEREEDKIVIPDLSLSRAHTNDLNNWAIPGDFRIDPRRVRIYVGKEDPVFTTEQVRKFSRRLGGVEIKVYPRDGHILFLTRPSVFDDIAEFFGLG